MDVAAPRAVINDALKQVLDGALNFSIESDGKIAFDAPQGFRLRVDFIELGEGIVERIHVAEPFLEGSVASMPDLLLLRAVAVVNRGDDGDRWDFEWLLLEVTKGQVQFPGICDEELEYLIQAVDRVSGVWAG